MWLWLSFALIASVHSSNKVCPDGSSSCPDFATCCELSDKRYGCCPYKNAVCCDDHIHCCPQNTKCEAGTCLAVSGLNMTAEKLSKKSEENFHCFDFCPRTFTCCEGIIPGTHDCCPLEHATCCSDGYRCCPKDTVCDVKKGRCIGKNYISEMYDFQKTNNSVKYLPLMKYNNVTNVLCPDSSSQCPNGYTCCKLLSGDWGCCPFVNATCCKDHLHCCPQNMQCDSTSQACYQGHVFVSSLLKELSEPVSAHITCPDNSTCAESMTCCELNNKRFGCCPYPNAVCCNDHSHCCPQDFICDVVEKQCKPKHKWYLGFMSKYYKKLG